MSWLTKVALANRAVVVLATLVIIGVGIFSAKALRQELIPSLTIPGASVVAVYPGASPQAVEREVVEPLENAVKGVSGVTKVSSTSNPNLATLRVEWEYGENSNDLEAKVRSAVQTVKSQLPQDVEPQVIVGDFSSVPIVFLAVSSDLPPAELASKLKTIAVPKLNGIDGVKSAEVSGQETREVVITTRAKDLNTFGVDSSQLAQLIPSYKAAIPAGAVSTGSSENNVEVGKALGSVADVQNLQLQGTDGPVALKEVATVVDRPVKQTSIARVNGKSALSLAVMKKPDGNTVTVAKQVSEALPDLTKQMGGNTRFITVFDQAPWIEQSIHDLTVEGGLGLIMAVIVILLFLRSLRATLITAISIPLSLLIALIVEYLTGYTLNLLTLSALTVAVGRVVDDSIVVIENIERHLHQGDEFSAATIVKATKEVAGAVTASTLTTVAVFAPISLVSGQAGEIFRPFGITVTVALLASLLVALTIVPVLASWFMRPSRRRNPEREARKAARQQANADKLAAAEAARHEKEYARAEAKLAKKQAKQEAWLRKHGADQETIDNQLAELAMAYAPPPATGGTHAMHEDAQTRLQRGYLPVLRQALRHPIITIALAIALFASTMALTTQLKTDFIGDAGQTSLSINQTMPAGTTLDATNAASKKVEAVLAKTPSVETFSTTVGSGSAEEAVFTGNSGGSNKATTQITLKKDTKGTDLAVDLRKQFAAMKGIGTVEVMTSDGATGSQTIDIKLKGTDEKALTAASKQVEDMLGTQKNLSQVKSDLAEKRTVWQVNVDEAKAGKLGMSQGTIGIAATQAIQGQKLGTITIGDVERDLYLRSQAPIASKDQLENLALPVTQLQNANAKKAAADDLSADQEAQQDDAMYEQRKALNEQEDKLWSSRRQLNDQLAQVNSQLRALRSAPIPPPQPLPTVSNPPAERAAQIGELSKAVEQLNEQNKQLDEQLVAMRDQRKKLNESEAQAAEMKAKSEYAQDAVGTSQPLKTVATVKAVPAPASITREDGSRTITVSAVPAKGDLGTATQTITKELANLKLPAGVQANIGGVAQEQADSFQQLFLAMAIAVAIVYMIMVGTFRSLLQPLILLVSVPFAATGAIALLLITGTPLGLPAMIGLLMLIGIVVTNAIVLIDLVNKYRDEGASIDDAVIHGSRQRLRPIIMTALATVMALFPMSLGLTGGGVFISKPLAIVVIGGLISSTLLTLILVPVLYHIVEHAKAKLTGWRRNRHGDDDQFSTDEVGLFDDADGFGPPPRMAE